MLGFSAQLAWSGKIRLPVTGFKPALGGALQPGRSAYAALPTRQLLSRRRATGHMSSESCCSAVLANGYGASPRGPADPRGPESRAARWATVGLLLVVIALAVKCSPAPAPSPPAAPAGTFGPSMVIAGCTGGAIGIALSGPEHRPVHQAACRHHRHGRLFHRGLPHPHRWPADGFRAHRNLSPAATGAMWVCSLCFLASGTKSRSASAAGALTPALTGPLGALL